MRCSCIAQSEDAQLRSTQTIAEVQPRDTTAPELTRRPTSSATKEQRGYFAEARTPNDRKLFREIIQNLAALDRRSTTEADEFTGYALSHYAAQMHHRPSVLAVLKRFFALAWNGRRNCGRDFLSA